MPSDKSTIAGNLWEGLASFGQGLENFVSHPDQALDKLAKAEAPSVNWNTLATAHKKLEDAQQTTGNKGSLPKDEKVLSAAGYLNTQTAEGKAVAQQVLHREKVLLTAFNTTKQGKEIHPKEGSNPLYLRAVENIYDKAGVSLLPPAEQIAHLQSSLGLSEKQAKEVVANWINRHPNFESRKSLYYQVQAEQHQDNPLLATSLYRVAVAYDPRNEERHYEAAKGYLAIAKEHPGQSFGDEKPFDLAQAHLGQLFKSRDVSYASKALLLVRASDRAQPNDKEAAKKTSGFLKVAHDQLDRGNKRLKELGNSNSEQSKAEIIVLTETLLDLADEVKTVSATTPEDQAVFHLIQGDLRELYKRAVEIRNHESDRPHQTAFFQLHKEEQSNAFQAYEARTAELTQKLHESEKSFDVGVKAIQAKLEESLNPPENGMPSDDQMKAAGELLRLDRELTEKDYSAWTQHANRFAALVDRLQDPEKRSANAALLLRDLVAIRDQLRATGNIGEVNALLKHWSEDLVGHLPPALTAKPGAKEATTHLVDLLVNENDQRVLAHLNPKDLEEYLEKVEVSEKLFADAKAIDTKTPPHDPEKTEKKKKLLVASLATLPALGDKKSVQERLTEVDQLVAQSDEVEKLKIYAAVVPTLKEVDKDVASPFRKKVEELAKKHDKNSAFVDSDHQLSYYRETMAVRAVYLALDDLAGVQRTKENLDSTGKILELRLQKGEVTRLDERLESATALLEIDHLYFDIAASTTSRVGKYFSESFSDKVVKESFDRSIKAHLPIWQKAMADAKAFEERHTTVDPQTGLKKLDERAVLAHASQIREAKAVLEILHHYEPFTRFSKSEPVSTVLSAVNPEASAREAVSQLKTLATEAASHIPDPAIRSATIEAIERLEQAQESVITAVAEAHPIEKAKSLALEAASHIPNAKLRQATIDKIETLYQTEMTALSRAKSVLSGSAGTSPIDAQEFNSFLNPVQQMLRQELEIDLEKRVGDGLSHFMEEQKLNDPKSEEAREIKLEVTQAVVADLKSVLKEQLENGSADELPQAQFNELVEKAALGEINLSRANLEEKQAAQETSKPKSAKQAKAAEAKKAEKRQEINSYYMKAAAIFARSGLKERAAVAMQPLAQQAETHPPLERLVMLNKMVEIYQTSGMTDEANQMLQKVVDLDTPPSKDPEIHEAAEIARASQACNKGDFYAAHEILVKVPDSEAAQQFAEAIQKTGRTQRVLETVKVLQTISLQYIAAGKEHAKSAGVNIDAVERDTLAGWQEVNRLLLTGEVHTLDEALKRIQSEGRFKNFTTGLGSDDENGKFKASFGYEGGMTVVDGEIRNFAHEVNDFSGNEKVFVDRVLNFADRLIGESQAGIAMEVYSAFNDHPLVGKEAHTRMTDRLREHARFEAAVEIAKNWTLVGSVASMFLSGANTEEIKNSPFELLSFGVGGKLRILAGGAHLVKAARAARTAQFLGSTLGRHATNWAIQKTAEAAAITLTNMSIESATRGSLENWTVGNFLKGTGNMFVMFGTMHVGGMAMQRLGKEASRIHQFRNSKAAAHEVGVHVLSDRAQKVFGKLNHAVTLTTMTISDYESEFFGLKDKNPTEEWMGFTDRLLHSAVTDKKMGRSMELLHKIDKKSAKRDARLARVSQRLDIREARAQTRARVGKAFETVQATRPELMHGMRAAAHARAEAEVKGRGEDPTQNPHEVQKRADKIVKDEVERVADTIATVEAQQGRAVDLKPEDLARRMEELGEVARKRNPDPTKPADPAFVRELFVYSYVRGNGVNRPLTATELGQALDRIQTAGENYLDRTGIGQLLRGAPEFADQVQGMVRFAIQNALPVEHVEQMAQVAQGSEGELNRTAQQIFGDANSPAAQMFRADVALGALYTTTNPADLRQNFARFAENAPRIAEDLNQIVRNIYGNPQGTAAGRPELAYQLVSVAMNGATVPARGIDVPRFVQAVHQLAERATPELVQAVDALLNTQPAGQGGAYRSAPALNVGEARLPLILMAVVRGWTPEAVRDLQKRVGEGTVRVAMENGQVAIKEGGKTQGDSQGFSGGSQQQQESKGDSDQADQQSKEQEVSSQAVTAESKAKESSFGQSAVTAWKGIVQDLARIAGRNPYPEVEAAREARFKALDAADRKSGKQNIGLLRIAESRLEKAKNSRRSESALFKFLSDEKGEFSLSGILNAATDFLRDTLPSQGETVFVSPSLGAERNTTLVRDPADPSLLAVTIQWNPENQQYTLTPSTLGKVEVEANGRKVEVKSSGTTIPVGKRFWINGQEHRFTPFTEIQAVVTSGTAEEPALLISGVGKTSEGQIGLRLIREKTKPQLNQDGKYEVIFSTSRGETMLLVSEGEAKRLGIFESNGPVDFTLKARSTLPEVIAAKEAYEKFKQIPGNDLKSLQTAEAAWATDHPRLVDHGGAAVAGHRGLSATYNGAEKRSEDRVSIAQRDDGSTLLIAVDGISGYKKPGQLKGHGEQISRICRAIIESEWKQGKSIEEATRVANEVARLYNEENKLEEPYGGGAVVALAEVSGTSETDGSHRVRFLTVGDSEGEAIDPKGQGEDAILHWTTRPNAADVARLIFGQNPYVTISSIDRRLPYQQISKLRADPNANMVDESLGGGTRMLEKDSNGKAVELRSSSVTPHVTEVYLRPGQKVRVKTDGLAEILTHEEGQKIDYYADQNRLSTVQGENLQIAEGLARYQLMETVLNDATREGTATIKVRNKKGGEEDKECNYITLTPAKYEAAYIAANNGVKPPSIHWQYLHDNLYLFSDGSIRSKNPQNPNEFVDTGMHWKSGDNLASAAFEVGKKVTAGKLLPPPLHGVAAKPSNPPAATPKPPSGPPPIPAPASPSSVSTTFVRSTSGLPVQGVISPTVTRVISGFLTFFAVREGLAQQINQGAHRIAEASHRGAWAVVATTVSVLGVIGYHQFLRPATITDNIPVDFMPVNEHGIRVTGNEKPVAQVFIFGRHKLSQLTSWATRLHKGSLKDPKGVSRSHFKIVQSLSDGSMELIDGNGTDRSGNGTYIQRNGQWVRLQAGEKHPLQPNELIAIGFGPEAKDTMFFSYNPATKQLEHSGNMTQAIPRMNSTPPVNMKAGLGYSTRINMEEGSHVIAGEANPVDSSSQQGMQTGASAQRGEVKLPIFTNEDQGSVGKLLEVSRGSGFVKVKNLREHPVYILDPDGVYQIEGTPYRKVEGKSELLLPEDQNRIEVVQGNSKELQRRVILDLYPPVLSPKEGVAWILPGNVQRDGIAQNAVTVQRLRDENNQERVFLSPPVRPAPPPPAAKKVEPKIEPKIESYGSSPKVNGEPIVSGKGTTIGVGDQLQVGDYQLAVQMKDNARVLMIVDDTGGTTTFPLNSPGVISIGRAKENVIRLTEQNISRRHLELVVGEDGSIIARLPGQQGQTEPVSSQVSEGARASEQVQHPARMEEPVAQVEVPRIGVDEPTLRREALPLVAAAASVQTAPVSRLTRTEGSHLVLTPRPNETEIILGRTELIDGGEKGAEITAPDGSKANSLAVVSRKHATFIKHESGRWFVHHGVFEEGQWKENPFGTTVTRDGRTILPDSNGYILLEEGDLVNLGDHHRIVFSHSEASRQAKADTAAAVAARQPTPVDLAQLDLTTPARIRPAGMPFEVRFVNGHLVVFADNGQLVKMGGREESHLTVEANTDFEVAGKTYRLANPTPHIIAERTRLERAKFLANGASVPLVQTGSIPFGNVAALDVHLNTSGGVSSLFLRRAPQFAPYRFLRQGTNGEWRELKPNDQGMNNFDPDITRLMTGVETPIGEAYFYIRAAQPGEVAGYHLDVGFGEPFLPSSSGSSPSKPAEQAGGSGGTAGGGSSGFTGGSSAPVVEDVPPSVQATFDRTSVGVAEKSQARPSELSTVVASEAQPFAPPAGKASGAEDFVAAVPAVNVLQTEQGRSYLKYTGTVDLKPSEDESIPDVALYGHFPHSQQQMLVWPKYQGRDLKDGTATDLYDLTKGQDKISFALYRLGARRIGIAIHERLKAKDHAGREGSVMTQVTIIAKSRGVESNDLYKIAKTQQKVVSEGGLHHLKEELEAAVNVKDPQNPGSYAPPLIRYSEKLRSPLPPFQPIPSSLAAEPLSFGKNKKFYILYDDSVESGVDPQLLATQWVETLHQNSADWSVVGVNSKADIAHHKIEPQAPSFILVPASRRRDITSGHMGIVSKDILTSGNAQEVLERLAGKTPTAPKGGQTPPASPPPVQDGTGSQKVDTSTATKITLYPKLSRPLRYDDAPPVVTINSPFIVFGNPLYAEGQRLMIAPPRTTASDAMTIAESGFRVSNQKTRTGQKNIQLIIPARAYRNLTVREVDAQGQINEASIAPLDGSKRTGPVFTVGYNMQEGANGSQVESYLRALEKYIPDARDRYHRDSHEGYEGIIETNWDTLAQDFVNGFQPPSTPVSSVSGSLPQVPEKLPIRMIIKYGRNEDPHQIAGRIIDVFEARQVPWKEIIDAGTAKPNSLSYLNRQNPTDRAVLLVHEDSSWWHTDTGEMVNEFDYQVFDRNNAYHAPRPEWLTQALAQHVRAATDAGTLPGGTVLPAQGAPQAPVQVKFNAPPHYDVSKYPDVFKNARVSRLPGGKEFPVDKKIYIPEKPAITVAPSDQSGTVNVEYSPVKSGALLVRYNPTTNKWEFTHSARVQANDYPKVTMGINDRLLAGPPYYAARQGGKDVELELYYFVKVDKNGAPVLDRKGNAILDASFQVKGTIQPVPPENNGSPGNVPAAGGRGGPAPAAGGQKAGGVRAEARTPANDPVHVKLPALLERVRTRISPDHPFEVRLVEGKYWIFPDDGTEQFRVEKEEVFELNGQSYRLSDLNPNEVRLPGLQRSSGATRAIGAAGAAAAYAVSVGTKQESEAYGVKLNSAEAKKPAPKKAAPAELKDAAEKGPVEGEVKVKTKTEVQKPEPVHQTPLDGGAGLLAPLTIAALAASRTRGMNAPKNRTKAASVTPKVGQTLELDGNQGERTLFFSSKSGEMELNNIGKGAIWVLRAGSKNPQRLDPKEKTIINAGDKIRPDEKGKLGETVINKFTAGSSDTPLTRPVSVKGKKLPQIQIPEPNPKTFFVDLKNGVQLQMNRDEDTGVYTVIPTSTNSSVVIYSKEGKDYTAHHSISTNRDNWVPVMGEEKVELNGKMVAQISSDNFQVPSYKKLGEVKSGSKLPVSIPGYHTIYLVESNGVVKIESASAWERETIVLEELTGKNSFSTSTNSANANIAPGKQKIILTKEGTPQEGSQRKIIYVTREGEVRLYEPKPVSPPPSGIKQLPTYEPKPVSPPPSGIKQLPTYEPKPVSPPPSGITKLTTYNSLGLGRARVIYTSAPLSTARTGATLDVTGSGEVRSYEPKPVSPPPNPPHNFPSVMEVITQFAKDVRAETVNVVLNGERSQDSKPFSVTIQGGTSPGDSPQMPTSSDGTTALSQILAGGYPQLIKQMGAFAQEVVPGTARLSFSGTGSNGSSKHVNVRLGSDGKVNVSTIEVSAPPPQVEDVVLPIPEGFYFTSQASEPPPQASEPAPQASEPAPRGLSLRDRRNFDHMFKSRFHTSPVVGGLILAGMSIPAISDVIQAAPEILARHGGFNFSAALELGGRFVAAFGVAAAGVGGTTEFFMHMGNQEVSLRTYEDLKNAGLLVRQTPGEDPIVTVPTMNASEVRAAATRNQNWSQGGVDDSENVYYVVGGVGSKSHIEIPGFEGPPFTVIRYADGREFILSNAANRLVVRDENGNSIQGGTHIVGEVNHNYVEVTKARSVTVISGPSGSSRIFAKLILDRPESIRGGHLAAPAAQVKKASQIPVEQRAQTPSMQAKPALVGFYAETANDPSFNAVGIRVIEVSPDAELKVGRADDAHVVSSALGVSRNHLSVKIENGEVVVTVNGSNGIYVDGKHVPPKSEVLRLGTANPGQGVGFQLPTHTVGVPGEWIVFKVSGSLGSKSTKSRGQPEYITGAGAQGAVAGKGGVVSGHIGSSQPITSVRQVSGGQPAASSLSMGHPGLEAAAVAPAVTNARVTGGARSISGKTEGRMTSGGFAAAAAAAEQAVPAPEVVETSSSRRGPSEPLEAEHRVPNVASPSAQTPRVEEMGQVAKTVGAEGAVLELPTVSIKPGISANSFSVRAENGSYAYFAVTPSGVLMLTDYEVARAERGQNKGYSRALIQRGIAHSEGVIGNKITEIKASLEGDNLTKYESIGITKTPLSKTLEALGWKLQVSKDRTSDKGKRIVSVVAYRLEGGIRVDNVQASLPAEIVKKSELPTITNGDARAATRLVRRRESLLIKGSDEKTNLFFERPTEGNSLLQNRSNEPLELVPEDSKGKEIEANKKPIPPIGTVYLVPNTVYTIRSPKTGYIARIDTTEQNVDSGKKAHLSEPPPANKPEPVKIKDAALTQEQVAASRRMLPIMVDGRPTLTLPYEEASPVNIRVPVNFKGYRQNSAPALTITANASGSMERQVTNNTGQLLFIYRYEGVDAAGKPRYKAYPDLLDYEGANSTKSVKDGDRIARRNDDQLDRNKPDYNIDVFTLRIRGEKPDQIRKEAQIEAELKSAREAELAIQLAQRSTPAPARSGPSKPEISPSKILEVDLDTHDHFILTGGKLNGRFDAVESDPLAIQFDNTSGQSLEVGADRRVISSNARKVVVRDGESVIDALGTTIFTFYARGKKAIAAKIANAADTAGKDKRELGTVLEQAKVLAKGQTDQRVLDLIKSIEELEDISKNQLEALGKISQSSNELAEKNQEDALGYAQTIRKNLATAKGNLQRLNDVVNEVNQLPQVYEYNETTRDLIFNRDRERGVAKIDVDRPDTEVRGGLHQRGYRFTFDAVAEEADLAILDANTSNQDLWMVNPENPGEIYHIPASSNRMYLDGEYVGRIRVRDGARFYASENLAKENNPANKEFEFQIKGKGIDEVRHQKTTTIVSEAKKELDGLKTEMKQLSAKSALPGVPLQAVTNTSMAQMAVSAAERVSERLSAAEQNPDSQERLDGVRKASLELREAIGKAREEIRATNRQIDGNKAEEETVKLNENKDAWIDSSSEEVRAALVISDRRYNFIFNGTSQVDLVELNENSSGRVLWMVDPANPSAEPMMVGTDKMTGQKVKVPDGARFYISEELAKEDNHSKKEFSVRLKGKEVEKIRQQKVKKMMEDGRSSLRSLEAKRKAFAEKLSKSDLPREEKQRLADEVKREIGLAQARLKRAYEASKTSDSVEALDGVQEQLRGLNRLVSAAEDQIKRAERQLVGKKAEKELVTLNNLSEAWIDRGEGQVHTSLISRQDGYAYRFIFEKTEKVDEVALNENISGRDLWMEDPQNPGQELIHIPQGRPSRGFRIPDGAKLYTSKEGGKKHFAFIVRIKGEGIDELRTQKAQAKLSELDGSKQKLSDLEETLMDLDGKDFQDEDGQARNVVREARKNITTALDAVDDARNSLSTSQNSAEALEQVREKVRVYHEAVAAAEGNVRQVQNLLKPKEVRATEIRPKDAKEDVNRTLTVRPDSPHRIVATITYNGKEYQCSFFISEIRQSPLGVVSEIVLMNTSQIKVWPSNSEESTKDKDFVLRKGDRIYITKDKTEDVLLFTLKFEDLVPEGSGDVPLKVEKKKANS